MSCLLRFFSNRGMHVRDRQVPTWFSEGVAEYARWVVLGEARFEAKQKAAYDPEISKIVNHGLSGAETYAAGARALRYMEAKYGADGIIVLMKSSEKWFADAIKKEPGVTVSEFEAGLKEWLKAR